MLRKRLYRAVLQSIRDFEESSLPLLGLAGNEGHLLLAPAGSHLRIPPFTNAVQIARTVFRQPAAYMSEETAFAAMRILNAQYKALDASPEASVACQAWLRRCLAPAITHVSTSAVPTLPAVTRFSHLQAQSTAPWTLAQGLQEASDLITQLSAAVHDLCNDDSSDTDDDDDDDDKDSQQGQHDDVAALPGVADSSAPHSLHVREQHHETEVAVRALVLQALQGKGLSAALDIMSVHVRSQLQEAATLIVPSPQAVGTVASGDQVLQAVRQHLYYDMGLRHAPIEWLYDGISPLLPASALAKGKAAPYILAVLAAMLCERLGHTAVPLRATAPVVQAASGAAAVMGGILMPHDVATRQAGRAASFIPTDSWLVALTSPTNTPATPQHVRAIDNALQGYSVVFLDVNVRGGAVLSEQEVNKKYPEALTSLPQGRLSAGPETYVQLCADWVRAVMVAHQRRGESDAVAHWLVQLLALDPTAPEWEFVLQHTMQPEIRLSSALLD